MTFRFKLLTTILVVFVILQSGCGPEDYQKPIQQFQDASNVVINATRAFLNNMNTVEQNSQLDRRVFEKQPLDLPGLDKIQIITPEEIKIRTNALDALTQYTSNLAQLAQGKEGSAVGDSTTNLPGRRLPGQLQLAIYRLVQKPMEKEHEIAKAYQTIAESKRKQRTTPQDNSVTGKIKRVLIGDDDPDIANAVDMAQVHHIASVVPLLGPLAADITEHFAQHDEGGALASLLSNIAAGKAIDSVGKGVAGQIRKVAPRTASIAGESTPVMAGQLKDAAPVAEEVAKTPSAKIAEQQQAAAQQGVKNVATKAANRALNKLGKSTDEAASFGDASKQIKEAVQPTFKKLDELSEGMFSTFQNKLANANKMIRKATSMEDLEKAETQAGEAQKGIDDLFKHHADEIGADDLNKAKAAYRDQSILSKVHSYVESAFSAPEDVADASGSVTRTLKGNALRPRLNQMLKKIPQPDLERVIGKDGVQSLYEIASMTAKPEGLADMQNMIGQIAAHGYITKLVKSPIEARNLVARYLATSPRVSHMAINALKFGTPAKVYAPIIANAIAESENK